MLQLWEMAEELAEKKVVGADGQVCSRGHPKLQRSIGAFCSLSKSAILVLKTSCVFTIAVLVAR